MVNVGSRVNRECAMNYKPRTVRKAEIETRILKFIIKVTLNPLWAWIRNFQQLRHQEHRKEYKEKQAEQKNYAVGI